MNAHARKMAEILKGMEPDRGNRYATRSVQAKGEARHTMWREVCAVMSWHFARTDRDAFLNACGVEIPKVKAKGARHGA